MKGTGRILAPEASALSLAPIRACRGPSQSLSPITSQPIIVREGRPRRKRCMLLQRPAEHAHSIHMLCVTVLCTPVSVCTVFCACVWWGGGECEMHFSFAFTFTVMTHILWVIPNIVGLVCTCTCCVSLFDMHEQNNLAPDAKINFDLFIFQMRKPCHDTHLFLSPTVDVRWDRPEPGTSVWVGSATRTTRSALFPTAVLLKQKKNNKKTTTKKKAFLYRCETETIRK